MISKEKVELLRARQTAETALLEAKTEEEKQEIYNNLPPLDLTLEEIYLASIALSDPEIIVEENPKI